MNYFKEYKYFFGDYLSIWTSLNKQIHIYIIRNTLPTINKVKESILKNKFNNEIYFNLSNK